MKNKKPIHLIVMRNSNCVAMCNHGCYVIPTESSIIRVRTSSYYSKGTFNPKKVTCKRCLKHSDYKIAIDKLKYPLFHWKDSM